MAALLTTAPAIDSEKAGLRFIEPIRKVIYDPGNLVLCEKSVRVGMTWGSAFADVRDSILTAKQDTLFTTKDQPTSFEYIRYCLEHLELFDATRSKISATEKEWNVPVFDEEGRDTGFVEKVTVSIIVFDNRSRIIAFSSNPNALRAYGGNVRWDEAAFAPKGRDMWAAIQGRKLWGGNVRVWSSLSNEDTMFDVLAQKAKTSPDTWSYHHIDIYEAIEAGLVELLNEKRGTDTTREAFLQDLKDTAALPDLFALEYEIKKSNSNHPIVPFEKIKAAERGHPIEREHLSHAQVESLFGIAGIESEDRRKRKVENWLRGHFENLFSARGSKSKRFRIGFDVAASRKGDLAAVWIEEKLASGERQLRGLLTFQTEDWDVMQWSLQTLLSYLPGEVMAAGDETGLGRQICWNLSKLYYGRFESVNFSRSKTDLGTLLMQELNAGVKLLARDHPDISADIYCIQKGIVRDRLVFTESKNELLPQSHADIAWASALASYADATGTGEFWGGVCG